MLREEADRGAKTPREEGVERLGGRCAQTARAFTWGARAKHPLRLVGATKNEIPDRGS